MKAWSMIRAAPWYRAQAFVSGLKAAGFEVRQDPPRGAEGNVLCIWNRYGHWHDSALRFEREGGTVICAENGYLGKGGTAPKFDVHPGGPKPHHYYAVACGWHNGRGTWATGGMHRFEALGVELKPWRAEGDHVLVCPNRSFGVGNQIMPRDWAERTVEKLREKTKRPIRIRAHPGNDAPSRKLEADLAGAWAVMVWSSGVAVHSLLAGIPTFIGAPFHVLKEAGARGDVDQPHMPDRVRPFARMAWAQWTVEEIERGAPFVANLRRDKAAASAFAQAMTGR